MADVTITATTVIPDSTTTARIQSLPAGETITAGMSVYISASSTLMKAKNNTSANAAAVGVAISGGSVGQMVQYMATNGDVIQIGGTVVVGETYYVSGTFGGICPTADIGAAAYVTRLGYATTTGKILLDIKATGLAHG